MKALLYRWPQVAKFGRVVPKNKFYERGRVTSAVRDKFVDEVQRITWAYKLAETTINLPGTSAVPELQVFQLNAKGDEVSDIVLTTIDKVVKTPIIFEIIRGMADSRQIRMIAAHKYFVTSAPKLGSYYSTSWQGVDTERAPLPTAINLPTLYAALLEPLLPICPRPGEEMSEVTARLDLMGKLEREIGALERKIRNEPQLNRKVDARRAIKAKQASLADLMSPTVSPTPVRKS